MEQCAFRRASNPHPVQERASVAEHGPGYHPDDCGPDNKEEEMGEDQDDQSPDVQAEEEEHEPRNSAKLLQESSPAQPSTRTSLDYIPALALPFKHVPEGL